MALAQICDGKYMSSKVKSITKASYYFGYSMNQLKPLGVVLAICELLGGFLVFYSCSVDINKNLEVSETHFGQLLPKQMLSL